MNTSPAAAMCYRNAIYPLPGASQCSVGHSAPKLYTLGGAESRHHTDEVFTGGRGDGGRRLLLEAARGGLVRTAAPGGASGGGGGGGDRGGKLRVLAPHSTAHRDRQLTGRGRGRPTLRRPAAAAEETRTAATAD